MIHALVQVFAGALHSGEHGYTVAAATPTHERKQGHMDKPDPYAELSAVMQDLTTQGVPEADIIDAAFRLAVTLPPACMARKRCHTACWTWLRWSGRRRTRARMGLMGESDPIAVQNAQVAGIITDQGEEPWMRNLSARPLPRKCGSSPWNWSEMDIRRQRSRMECSWLRWTPRPDRWAAPLVELPWQAGAPVPGGGRRG